MNDVKHYFDAHAPRWEQLYTSIATSNDWVLQERKAITLAYAARYIPKGSHIFDAGCGAGILASDLAKQGYRLTCADISQEMMARCQATFEKSGLILSSDAFLTGDVAGNARPAPQSTDAVIAVGFLEYQADEQAMLHALNGCLHPGGILICTGPVGTRLADVTGLNALHRLWLRLRGITPPAHPTRNVYNLPRLRALLEMAGFSLLHHTYHGYAGFPFIDSLLPLKGQVLFSQLLTIVSNILPIKRFANDLVVVARKGDAHA